MCLCCDIKVKRSGTLTNVFRIEMKWKMNTFHNLGIQKKQFSAGIKKPNTANNLDILATSLIVQYNYLDTPT